MSNEEKVLLKKYKESRKIKMLVQGAAILILQSLHLLFIEGKKVYIMLIILNLVMLITRFI